MAQRDRPRPRKWHLRAQSRLKAATLGICIAAAPAYAQSQAAPPIQWSYLTEMTGLQSFRGVDVRPDGGIAVVGASIDDIFTALYAILSPDGAVVRFAQPAGDDMRTKSGDIAILPNGITAFTLDRWNPDDRYVGGILIVDANHIANIFKATFELARTGYFRPALGTTANGNFVLAQSYAPGGALAADAFLIWFSPAGSVMAQQRFQGPEDAGFNDVAGLANGGALAVGWTGTEEQEQQWAVRLDPARTIVWEQTYEFIGRLKAVAALPGGGAVMAGYHQPNPEARTFQGVILWIDDAGTVTAHATVDDAGSVSFDAVVAMPDGGAVAAGYLRDSADSDARALAVRFGPDGQVLWRYEPDHPLSSQFYDIAVLPDGGIAAAGAMRMDGEIETVALGDSVGFREDTTVEAVRETEAWVVVFSPET